MYEDVRLWKFFDLIANLNGFDSKYPNNPLIISNLTHRGCSYNNQWYTNGFSISVYYTHGLNICDSHFTLLLCYCIWQRGWLPEIFDCGLLLHHGINNDPSRTFFDLIFLRIQPCFEISSLSVWAATIKCNWYTWKYL